MRWPSGLLAGVVAAVVRPGLDSHALLNGPCPKASPSPAPGKVSEPERSRLGADATGVSRLAADDAVCRRAGREAVVCWG